MDKVSITITTDKPVKISVTPNESAGGKDGLARLLEDVKEDGHVVSSEQDTASVKG